MSKFGSFLGNVLRLVGYVYFPYFTAAFDAVRNSRMARAERRRARQAYNDALTDRLQQMSAQPASARRLVLGQVRLAGMELRPAFSHGDNSERLTMVLEFAGHEIDAFVQWYADDTPITLDVDGWCTTEPWAKVRLESLEASGTLNGAGGGTIALEATPVGTVSAAVGLSDGEWHLIDPGSVSVAGTTVTIAGAEPDAAVRVQYQVTRTTYLLRIRPYSGTATQSVGTDLAAEYGANMRATDHYRGIAMAVVDMVYDQDVYTAGPPVISALVRGAKVYDRRADTTAGGSGTQRLADPTTWAYSNNAAVLLAHYMRHANGLALGADETSADDVDEAADWADQSTVFTLRKADTTTTTVTLPRHSAGTVISTDTDPRQVFNELLNAMHGNWGMDGGVLRLRAGMMRTPVAALDQDWLVRRLDEGGQPSEDPVVAITNGVPREAQRNSITGRCVDSDQRYQVLAYPPVRDAVLIAADGEMAGELDFSAVTHQAQAQHLASMAIRETMAGLRADTVVGLQAYALELFDVVDFNLARYGMVDKTMEVVGKRWHPVEGIALRFSEITDAMFTVEAELTGRDPAPNSALPRPWEVEAITGLTVQSNTAATADGSVLVRLEAEWDAATTAAVRVGKIELQYADLTNPLPAGDGWVSWEEHGSATAAIIPGVRANAAYVVRARGVTFPAGRVNGDWCQHVLVSTATVPLVGTDGIEPEAATEIVELKTVYSDVVYGTGLQVVAGAAITPPVDARVVVVANFDASGVVGFESTRWAALFIDEMANVTVGTEVDYSDAGISAGTCLFGDTASVGTARTKCSVTYTFDAAAGVPCLVGLATSNSVAFSTGLTFYGRPRLQVQLIKR